jgi:hypothetical protein
MNRFTKFGIVLAGYVAAVLVAGAALEIRLLNTQGPDAQASAGMQAFGDLLLFLGVFGFAALFPTGVALNFLRHYERLWTVFSLASLTLALIGPVAAVVLQSHQRDWLIAGLIWLGQVLGAPLLALGFLVGTFLAPTRRARWMLLVSALIEGLVSAYVFLCLFVLQHWL